MRSLTALDETFVETAETLWDLLFWRAQRLVLGLERLADFVNRTKPDLPRSAELTELRQDLRWAGEFDPARFADRLRKYRRSLDGAAR